MMSAENRARVRVLPIIPCTDETRRNNKINSVGANPFKAKITNGNTGGKKSIKINAGGIYVYIKFQYFTNELCKDKLLYTRREYCIYNRILVNYLGRN